MAELSIKNPVLGGIADTKQLGAQDSVARMVGIDLHGEPGIIRANQRSAKESGVLIDGFVKQRVNCSNGEIYFFSADSGKVWRRSSSGTYSLAYTTSPAAGAAGCLGAREYNGYVYWATQNRLHRISTTNALVSTWTTLDLNWATFTNGDDAYHPMAEQNLVLYIGDANDVAQVDVGTFTADALDFDTTIGTSKRISSLGKYFTDLLIGTFVNANIALADIFRWNTWSDSFSVTDDVPEIGCSAFLAADNQTLVAAGRKGFIYSYNGTQLDQLRRIPGDWTKDKAATVFMEAVANRNGTPLFGVSNVSGDPCDQGVYSLGRFSPSFPAVLNLEYPISTGKIAGVSIGTLTLYGNTLVISWKQDTTVTITIAAPGVVTYAAHGLSNGTPIVFTTTGALPTGITSGTVYYARSVTADTLNLYDTAAHAIAGGSTGRITTSGSQSGSHTASIYGVDSIDNTAKIGALTVDEATVAGPFIESRVIDAQRDLQKTFHVMVPYRSLPSGTSIKIFYKVNNGAWTENTVVVDTINQKVETDVRITEANTVQFRAVLVTSSDSTPEVEQLLIELD